ncbi:hypothetical protein SELMODRAFT_405839 [Selaginella moellendorffii]|uniref:Class II aldolase/adducin N-terminal domain-containing protein n=1 Tax=Selaginella moellendorffii TaxID=88036 RepID=D8QZV1_SELML|nr:hypothetical protein SELMODRAFT_405839 [Selaginella moellendorffii]
MTAVLVKNHGIYVWGDSWFCAKTQAECYHYLFDAALKLRQFRLDHTDRLYGPVKKLSLAAPRKNYPARNAVYLCGFYQMFFSCAPPLPFCFPMHMIMWENTAEIKLSCYVKQALKDTKERNVQTQLIPPSDAPKDEAYIWRTGYKNGELKGQAYIYSSGSREAQRLIFGKHKLWDTSIPQETNKRHEVTLKFPFGGVDEPSQITLPRAVAGKEAGLDTVILERPGNALLPSGRQAPFGTLMILKVCKLLLKQRIAPWGSSSVLGSWANFPLPMHLGSKD